MVKKKKEMSKTAYNGVLLENLHHKMDTVIESLQEYDAGSRQRDEDIKRELKQDVQMVSAAVQMLSKELQSVREDLGQKIDKIHTRLDHHEDDITLLKQAVH